jgi:hypothetical protein
LKGNQLPFDKFWKKNKKQLPKLFKLAIKYTSSPATSVASESSFSVAGYLQRKTRARLSAKALKYSILIKDSFNIDLFEN